MPNVCHVICDTWHVQNPWIFICQPFKPAKLKQLKPSDSTDALLLQYWTASNYTVNYLDPDNIALVPALVWTRDNQMNVFRLCVDVITNWTWSSVPPLHPAWISIQYSTWYTRKNTFYPDLLHYWSVENKEYYIWFIAADETARPHTTRSWGGGSEALKLAPSRVWPPAVVSGRRALLLLSVTAPQHSVAS